MEKVIGLSTINRLLKNNMPVLTLAKWSIGIALSISMVTFFTPKQAAKSEKQNDFIALKAEIKDLLDLDENTFLFCRKKKSIWHSKQAFYKNMEHTNDIRNKHMANLKDKSYVMYNNQEIDKPTYNTINQLIAWNRDLLLTGDAVCTSALKNKQQLAHWRKSLLTAVNQAT